jgi:hypothetical protein
VDLPTKFDRFREIWGWDTEFRPDANHRPDLVTLFAKEIRSGRTVRMRLTDLVAARKLPFGDKPDTLVESYSAVAELACCLTAGVRMPLNVLCTYAETSALVNGQDIEGLSEKRPTLLEACDLFLIEHMDKERKAAVRDLILNKDPANYTLADWEVVEDYNADDVDTDIKLFMAEAAAIDVPRALFRGQYSKVVAAIEHVGFPVHAAYIRDLETVWPDLRRHYIHELDTLRLYNENDSFDNDRMAALIDAREWSWPRTATGKYALDRKTLGKMVARHPELKQTQKLRDQIAELRMGAFVNTIGADGHSRCPIMPWWTRTFRNQPQGRDLVFLLSLPAWIHGVVRPPEGYGLACLDWVAQEFGLGAGFSGDPEMIADFLSGDPHMGLAIRTGLAPEGATKDNPDHRKIRDTVKPVSLGIPYGISKYGVARQTNKSLRWAQEVLTTARQKYKVYFKWQEGVWLQALADGKIVSPLGCPMAVDHNTPKRTLLNYLHQAGGADAMRLAAVAGTAAGITIVAPVHDAFWIMAPTGELNDAIAEMSRVMRRAGAIVSGGLEIPVEVSAKVVFPYCLGDVRRFDAEKQDKGQALWLEIQRLTCDILRRKTG